MSSPITSSFASSGYASSAATTASAPNDGPVVRYSLEELKSVIAAGPYQESLLKALTLPSFDPANVDLHRADENTFAGRNLISPDTIAQELVNELHVGLVICNISPLNLRVGLSFLINIALTFGAKIFFDLRFDAIIVRFKAGFGQLAMTTCKTLEKALREQEIWIQQGPRFAFPQIFAGEIDLVIRKFDILTHDSLQLNFSAQSCDDFRMLRSDESRVNQMTFSMLHGINKSKAAIVQVKQSEMYHDPLLENPEVKYSELAELLKAFDIHSRGFVLVRLPDVVFTANGVDTFVVEFEDIEAFLYLSELFKVNKTGYSVKAPHFRNSLMTWAVDFAYSVLNGPVGPYLQKMIPGWDNTEIDLRAVTESRPEEAIKIRRFLPKVSIPRIGFSNTAFILGPPPSLLGRAGNLYRHGQPLVHNSFDRLCGYNRRPLLNIAEMGHAAHGQVAIPVHGRQRGGSHTIDLARIVSGEDVRTTVMLRNIPNRMTQSQVLEILNYQFKGAFDFFYLRIDFRNMTNVGYGFVNFFSADDVYHFVRRIRGCKWPESDKVADVSYATMQGRETLIQKFRNSNVMQQDESCRPKLFDINGEEEEFPGPDNYMQLQRSIQNGHQDGLYTH